MASIEDAREEQYRASFLFWRGLLPPAARRPGGDEPPAGLASRARTAVIPAYGQTMLDELQFPVKQSSRSLLRTIVVAGSRAVPESDGRGVLDAWGRSLEANALRVYARAMAGALTFVDRLAARDAADPALVPPDPSLPPPPE